MTPTLTLDTSAVIGLVKAGVFAALKEAYRSVAVPREVLEECRSCADVVQQAASEGWLSIHVLGQAPAGPGSAGDRAALALATSLGTPLATDDRSLRARAGRRKVSVLSTLDILVVLKRLGWVASVAECIQHMGTLGEGISDAARIRALIDAGEAP